MEKSIVLYLHYHPPLAWHALISFFCSRGSFRVEQLMANRYLRTIQLDDHTGWVAARQDTEHNQIVVEVSPSLSPYLSCLQRRLHTLFDLDAEPAIIEAHLNNDKTLRQLIANNSGLRVPRTLDAFELSLRAILGQQVTVKAATTLYSRFVTAFGKPVETPFPGLDRTAPVADAIANAKLQTIIDLGLTQRRALTIHQLAQKIREGALDLEQENRTEILRQLLELPGIGPWTAQYIAMRALGDPNAIPESDLGLMRALQLKNPMEVRRRTEKWQPWRAYGAIYLWHHLT
ncbi:DNA-3-methyladenine glycosylase family protein [Nitrosomonas nitrosa]|uniref:DNA-3-methyladenine glycosylase family protein n=1 Tax=Nitrosomonas nitrosa TaxID=52442 RepID=UPI0023F6ED11|nr:DNA-3-methyladenine glycosylase [Nitrosomonas nitrosa]MCO6433618.1 DNA-3-methyladenine glycosylase 2 family protein [Nitrosomonas nitrosa]